ncbi:MAG TPA: hypothetical protein VJI74_02025 [Candidatus Paceibacterota bacterium]
MPKVRKAKAKVSKKVGGGKKGRLTEAQGEQCFWTCSGMVISNLAVLRDTLARMSDEEYAYHANREKNDFAKWVKEILHDPLCAKALLKARNRKAAAAAVSAALKRHGI